MPGVNPTGTFWEDCGIMFLKTHIVPRRHILKELPSLLYLKLVVLVSKEVYLRESTVHRPDRLSGVPWLVTDGVCKSYGPYWRVSLAWAIFGHSYWQAYGRKTNTGKLLNHRCKKMIVKI